MEQIENSPADLFGPPVQSLEEDNCDDKESDQDSEEQEDDEYIRPNWMILSEMRPNAIIENASTLDFRDINVNHDWVGDVRRRCSYLDLADTSDFIR